MSDRELEYSVGLALEAEGNPERPLLISTYHSAPVID
jgi:hypothetical protein